MKSMGSISCSPTINERKVRSIFVDRSAFFPSSVSSLFELAAERLHQYEEQFAQRPTLIRGLPRLQLKEIDLDQCIALEVPPPPKPAQPSPMPEITPRRFSLSRRLHSKSSDQISQRSENLQEVVSPIKLNKFDGLVFTHGKSSRRPISFSSPPSVSQCAITSMKPISS